MRIRIAYSAADLDFVDQRFRQKHTATELSTTGQGVVVILTVLPVDGSFAGGAGACSFFLHLWSFLD